MEDDGDRYFSMSITSAGPSTLPKNIENSFAPKITNDVSDIDGATRTASRYERFVNKPLHNDAYDVPGSKSKPLTHSRNVRDNSLYVDDIDGTRPFIKERILMTKRQVNPLNPEYPLPSFASTEPYEPKFIRDTLDIRDIDGSRSKPLHRSNTRDTYSNSDIVGAQVGWRPRHE
jgi:hypothetical protein